jgi:hypothetical protein
MLGLSYVTRYSGMDATLGLAFAGTGGCTRSSRRFWAGWACS